MAAAPALVNAQTLSERLGRYYTTLGKLNTERADKRIIKSWEARISKLEESLATGVDQDEEADMPRTAVKDKPKPTAPTMSKKDQAKARQAEVAKNKAQARPTPAKQTPAKATTKQPVKGKGKAPVTHPRGQAPKGTPGKNNIVYPDLNITDPTFGGRGTTHCMCGCGVTNRRGGKFSAGHDNRFRMLLGRIERGEEGGDSIAQSTLVDLKSNKTLTVGHYTAKDIIKLSTRKLRKSAGRK